MKTFFLFFFLTTSVFAFGQTKIIAHKSHSGSIESFATEKDGNFGNPPTHFIIWDTVVRISNTAFVKIWHQESTRWYCPKDSTQTSRPTYFYDTLQRVFKPDFDFPAFKRSFSENTVFIGFDDFPRFYYPNNEINPNNQVKDKRKNDLWFLFLLLGGGLSYIFVPNLKRSLLSPN